MLRIHLVLLRFFLFQFWYRNLIMADMFLLELELCLWRALKDRNRAINAMLSCHARTERLIQACEAQIKTIRDIRTQSIAKAQIKAGKNND